MNIQTQHNILIDVRNYFISEIDKIVEKSYLKRKCMAIKNDGTRCTRNIKSCNQNDKVCKLHEKAKNVSLMNERKSFSCVLYHNHLPNELNLNCPKCNLIKTTTN